MSKLLTSGGASFVMRLNQHWSKSNYMVYHHHYHHSWQCSQIRLVSSQASSSSSAAAATTTTTTTSSFFSHTSGRARRRRQRQQIKRQWKQKRNNDVKRNMRSTAAADKNKPPADTRTVMDILFPNPYKGQKVPEDMLIMTWKLPTSFSMFRTSLSMAWKEYKSTWKGFFSSRGILVEDVVADDDDDDDDDKKNETDNKKTATCSNNKKDIKNTKKLPSLQENVANKRDEIVGNVKRNVQFLADETETIRKKVREETGINNVEDLKRLAGDMMRLAKDCLNEFMAGYRKGRDDEVDKMLTQYFKELEEEANKPKKRRRKPKRRVLRKYYL